MGNGISVQYEHLALIGFFMILCESMGKYFGYVLQERASNSALFGCNIILIFLNVLQYICCLYEDRFIILL